MTPTADDGFIRERYSSADGTDYRAIHESRYGGFGDDRTGYADDGTQYEYTIVGNADLSLRTMRAEGGRRGGTIGPREDHVVFWLTRGRAEMRFPDRTRTVLPGQPHIASASESYGFESEGTVYNGIHVADGFLRRAGREAGIVLPHGPLLFDQQDTSVARLAPLRSTVAQLAPDIRDPRVRGSMRDAINRRIAVVVLDAFPLREQNGARPPRNALREAVLFLEAHALEPISLDDVAAAAHLSPRGLQQVFARTLGTTPMVVLRHHRLDQARRELLRSHPDGTVIRVVAARWQFGNPGRFSGYYRDRFGELPADTLVRAGDPTDGGATQDPAVRESSVRAVAAVERRVTAVTAPTPVQDEG